MLPQPPVPGPEPALVAAWSFSRGLCSGSRMGLQHPKPARGSSASCSSLARGKFLIALPQFPIFKTVPCETGVWETEEGREELLLKGTAVSGAHSSAGEGKSY